MNTRGAAVVAAAAAPAASMVRLVEPMNRVLLEIDLNRAYRGPKPQRRHAYGSDPLAPSIITQALRALKGAGLPQPLALHRRGLNSILKAGTVCCRLLGMLALDTGDCRDPSD